MQKISSMLFAMVFLVSAVQVFAQDSRDTSLHSSKFKSGTIVRSAFRDVVKPASVSTVSVLADGKQVALGAVVDANGWIVTKASELKGSIECRLSNGKRVNAIIKGSDPSIDLALLKVNAKGLKAVAWATEKNPSVGKWVATCGSEKDPVAVGVIGVPRRRIPRVPPVIGVNIQESERGPQIAQVFPNTGGAKAGLRNSDIITHAAGRRTETRESLIRLLGNHTAGDTIDLTIQRGNQSIKKQVTLSRRQQVFPDNPQANVQNRLGGELSNRRDGFVAVIQHDTVLRPNECGGPLVDLSGKAIGINIARAGRIESYALPVDLVRAAIVRLKP